MSFRSQQSFVSRTNSTYSVFFVNNGYMFVIHASRDATIEEIQNSICDKTSIPHRDQMIFLADGNVPPSHTNLAEEEIGTERKPLYLYRRNSNEDATPSSEQLEALQKLISQYKDDVDRIISSREFRSTVLQSFAKRTSETAQIVLGLAEQLVSDHEHLNKAWIAMIMFLDDRSERLYRRYGKFETMMRKLETARKDGHIILNDFGLVFDTLKRITLPQELTTSMSSTESTSGDSDEITLYDWIRSKDPVFHLDDLVTHVQESLGKLDDKPVKEIKMVLDETKSMLVRKEIREIGHLDERLKTFRTQLQNLKDRGKAVVNVGNEVAHNSEVLMKNPDTFKNVLERILQIHADIQRIIRSKIELITVIRQRARKNFLSAYEVLFKADGKMIAFEERARTLGDQLKLLNQIREAPILYVTIISEVIRRATLQKEFSSWLKIHIEKCNEFLDEENKIRTEFNPKLEKHFLRQLFPGLMEKMPVFHSQVHPFDTRIPKINHSYLHQLRENLKEMANLMNVTVPDVFNRLLVIDKNSPISVDTSHNHLRREESFFTHEKTSNLDTINKNFPSSNYLSGFEDGCSPGSFNIQRFGQGYSSQTSLNFTESAIGTPCGLKPLSFDLGPKEDETPRTSYYAKSDPINIPARSSNPMSATSSQFNTPEDAFDSPDKHRHQQQLAVPEEVDKTKQVATLMEFKSIILSCKEEIEGVKDLLRENEVVLKEKLQLPALNEGLRQIQEGSEDQKNVVEQVKVENEGLSKIIEHEKYLRHEKETELEECHHIIKRQNDDMLKTIKAKDDLHADILRLETEKRKLEQQLQSDASMDYLGIELKTLEEILKRPLAEDEIERIKSEIEQRRRVISPALSEHSDRGSRNSQTDYEHALRTKMQLIIQGIENKKDLEIAKMRDEIQSSINAEKAEYENLLLTRITELEKKVSLYQNLNEERTKTPPFIGSPPNDRPGPSAESFFGKSMQESCLVVNPGNSKNDYDCNRIDEEDEEVAIAGEDEITEINTVGTQTRIRMKEMSMMISLQDIHEGCSVLVMWDNSHNSYMVFSTSRTLHFVRESCMKRFCSDTQSSTRRNWMFAVVTHIDYCQIRKETNRYNMPLGTRFYRVEVKPLAIEQSSTAPSRRS
ncbi:hypothetical protein FO519_002978 [Halicephalobus sp. NKZ332]|nr:hypothetical protein FO519_002978 [Halicephalobus sp. NKZ332]